MKNKILVSIKLILLIVHAATLSAMTAQLHLQRIAQTSYRHGVYIVPLVGGCFIIKKCLVKLIKSNNAVKEADKRFKEAKAASIAAHQKENVIQQDRTYSSLAPLAQAMDNSTIKYGRLLTAYSRLSSAENVRFGYIIGTSFAVLASGALAHTYLKLFLKH